MNCGAKLISPTYNFFWRNKFRATKCKNPKKSLRPMYDSMKVWLGSAKNEEAQRFARLFLKFIK